MRPHTLLGALVFGLTAACSAPEPTGPDDGVSFATDTGAPDTTDAGKTDTGNTDIGEPDAASTDTATSDAGLADSGPTDTGPTDTGPADTGPADTGPADTGPTDAGPISCGFGFTWSGPDAGTFHALGDPVVLSGTVQTTAWALDKLQVAFTVGGVAVGTAKVAKDGKVSLSTTTLPQGAVTVSARILTPGGPCQGTTERTLGVCQHKIAESFDSKPTGKVWKTWGDAYWESAGYLEITGNAKSKQGAFYDVIHDVTPGDASVRFRIATGGGINGGADGYALNFVEVQDIKSLESIIQTAKKGGCLGYGVAGKCGSLKINAFHVEFDTWQNKGDPVTDPTPSNHVGILLNGDAGDHKLHVAVPQLEDLKWHDVRVDVVGTTVRVWFDGVKKVDKAITGLDFRGGRIFISGSTGWATNFHRLDDLVVLHGCK